MSEQKFKVGDRVRLVNDCSGAKAGEIYELIDYCGLPATSNKETGLAECTCQDNWNLAEEIPKGKPYHLNGKTYYAFPEGKTIKELNIDTSRKFIVVGESNFKIGDILKLDEDDDTSAPFFRRINDNHWDSKLLKNLAYYDEEVEEEKPKECSNVTGTLTEEVFNKAIECLRDAQPIKWERYEWGAGYGKSLPNNIIKPTGKTFMNNIVSFAKDAALAVSNPDERLRRKVGLKDSNGNWTSDAMTIVLDLESQSLEYKDTNDMVSKLGLVGAVTAFSPFEIHALFVKYDSKLLEIAKAKEEEENKK